MTTAAHTDEHGDAWGRDILGEYPPPAVLNKFSVITDEPVALFQSTELTFMVDGVPVQCSIGAHE